MFNTPESAATLADSARQALRADFPKSRTVPAAPGTSAAGRNPGTGAYSDYGARFAPKLPTTDFRRAPETELLPCRYQDPAVSKSDFGP